MGRSLSKAMLVSELAQTTSLNGKDVERLLSSLADIAFREAVNGFVIPRICKLKVVRKKPRQCRNPVTGRLMRIGERDTLKIQPLKAARDAVTPRSDDLITILDEPALSPPAESSAPTAAPEQPAPTHDVPKRPDMGSEGQILFECSECKSTLSASPAEAGMEGKCPYCENPIHVPEQRTPIEEEPTPTRAAASSRTVQEFVTLNCHTCDQEIEAPSEMIGMEVACPACSAPLLIEKPDSSASPVSHETVNTPDGQNVDLSSMTIRIDLSDLE